MKHVEPIKQKGIERKYHNTMSAWLKLGKGVIGNQAMDQGKIPWRMEGKKKR